MKKNDIIAYLVLAVNFIAGVLNYYLTSFHFVAGLICGSSGITLLFVIIGKRRAAKAAENIDAIIGQKKRY